MGSRNLTEIFTFCGLCGIRCSSAKGLRARTPFHKLGILFTIEAFMSNRPIIDFLRESRLLRKVLIVGALVAGVYFLGVKMEWWQLTIGG